ncbi:Na+/H+ antiporter NhaC family protein [Bacillota bacterium Meth-B3]
MFLNTTVILIAMAAAFVLSGIFLKSTEISMVIAGVVGMAFGVAHGWQSFADAGRILVEGLFTNLDLALLFVTASLFVNVYAHGGALAAVTRKLVSRFDSKWALLSFMAVFMLIPGAITGAGSVSVFVMGALVSTVVGYMGLSPKKTAAFVFIFAILSAAAPPINLWTMMMTAQANMPYVGFTWLLLIPIVIVGAFTIAFLGWGSKRESKEKILSELPEAPEGMNWVRIALPPLVLVLLLVASLVIPFRVPVMGMPLIFVLSTVVAMLVSPRKTSFKEYYGVMNRTMEQVFPLLATVLSVGVMQNVMAAVGVKGLIGITFVTLPMAWIYAAILLVAPFSQACMSYGSAIVIATPLIFMFNTAGFNTTVVAAALSLMFPIGDCLPPSRIVGRITIETVGYQGSYTSFLAQVLVPCLLLGALALVMMMMPGRFAFLI